MSAPATVPPVGVDELRRAWLAVQAGDFRHPHPHQHPLRHPSPSAPGGVWTPASGEQVVPVIGTTGSCGATTLALALATAAGGPARVVECAPAPASGLPAASTTELGTDDHGWARGSRDLVRLDRAGALGSDPDRIPPPPPGGPGITVVDIGNQVELLLAGHGWVTGLLVDAPTLVVVARATVPGLRRLECCLHQLGADRTLVAILGPPRRRWPRVVAHCVGALTADRIAAGRLVDIPEDRQLAIRGLTPDPLPARLLARATTLLPLTQHTTTTGEDHHP